VRLVELVVEAVPDDTIFVTSHGNVDFWADAHLQLSGHARYLRAGQSGSLGAEVPYGVAARLACRQSPVVVFVGDGGFGFHGLELETAVRYGAPIIVVVADDSSWAAIALPQRRVYGKDIELSLPRREWSHLAAAIGCHGEAPTDAADIGPAIRRSLDSTKPSIVHVPIASVESPYIRFMSGDPGRVDDSGQLG
jgi:acetolactate synthase-1/2/3 large subunit